MQFQISSRTKTGKEIPDSSRLEFLEKSSANNFALSDAEDCTSKPLNRGRITDLPLLRTLLAIRRKCRQPGFWKVVDSSFSSLCKFGSLNNPFATITSLSQFTLDSEDLFCRYKLKK